MRAVGGVGSLEDTEGAFRLVNVYDTYKICTTSIYKYVYIYMYICTYIHMCIMV